MFGDQQYRFHCRLPFFSVVFRVRQLGDVERGVVNRQPARCHSLDVLAGLQPGNRVFFIRAARNDLECVVGHWPL